MKLINEGNLKRGSIILFDEPQTSISSKDHQQQANKVFYQLTSTFRHRGFVLIFCNPFLEDLDKSTRKLFHAHWMVQSKDANNKIVKLKPQYLEWVGSKDDWYRHFLKVVFKPEGKSKFISQKLTSWDIPHPPEELSNAYEVKKLAFTTELNKRIEARLQSIENKDIKPIISPIDRLTDRQIECIEAVLEHGTQVKAAEVLGINRCTLSLNLKGAEKKGICLRNYKELKESRKCL